MPRTKFTARRTRSDDCDDSGRIPQLLIRGQRAESDSSDEDDTADASAKETGRDYTADASAKEKFMYNLVNTTNNADQSNCKYTQGPGYMAIEATRHIKAGDELLLFKADNDDNSSDYNDPLNLEKKSTGDKPKRSDENDDDNSRDDNDRLDMEKKIIGDKRKWSDKFSEDDVKDIRTLDFAKRELGVKIANAKSQLEFYEKRINKMNGNKNVILGKGDELSQDEWYKAMTKQELYFWEEQIQGVVDKTNFILGGVYSENDLDLKKKSN